jgi:hypothetical protein
MLWLNEHAHMIDWQLAEDIKKEVLAYVPQKK